MPGVSTFSNAELAERMAESIRKEAIHSVFVLFEHGDDYHGSGIVGIFSSRELADAKKKEAETGEACPECGDRPTYIVTEHEIKRP